MSERCLADALRAASDAELLALLRTRPDLAVPLPADTGVLARRARTVASLTRVFEQLDAFALTVVDALLVAGADTDPVPVPEVIDLLGVDVPGERARQTLASLASLAITWYTDDTDGDTGSVHVAYAAREARPTFPAGLGRDATELEGVDVTGVLATLGSAERGLLGKLAEGPPIGRTRDAASSADVADDADGSTEQTPVQRLLARNLLLRRDEETVELPMQVALAIRGDRPLGTVEPYPPALKTVSISESTVDSNAAAEVMQLVRHAERLLESWSADPPAVLRSGGLGMRELRRIATDLDVDERRAALLAELVVAAGLAAVEEYDEKSEWVPTTRVDGWLAAPTEHRWAPLAAAWLRLPRLPALAATRDARSRPLAPLSEDLHRPRARADRAKTLSALSEIERGVALDPVDSLAALLAWRSPRQAERGREQMVRDTLDEAITLGVAARAGTGGFAMSNAGRVLLAHDADAAARVLAEALPESIDHVMAQADLTLIAPGPLRKDLADEVALFADVETTGSATVYRVSEASVRRALDAGRTAGELHELLRTRSKTPVPQGLGYLIDDVARRHGVLRAGMANAFLRCDDEVLLSELLAGATAPKLELRRIAPTVLISPVPLVELLGELRDAGYTPVAEGPDGTVLDLRRTGRRTTAHSRSRARPEQTAGVGEEQLQAAVRQVRTGDRAANARRGRAVSLDAGAGASAISVTLPVLRSAARARRRVWIGLVDTHGIARQHVLVPERVGGGVLEGDDPEGTRHRVPLHLITSVAPVDDG